MKTNLVNWRELDQLVLDFETHYGTKYSLTQMTYMEYVFDSRFYVQGFSYSLNGSAPQWVPPENVSSFLNNVDWSNTNLICHNTHFDASILFWKYDIQPAFYMDTMLMGRILVPGSASLDTLLKVFFPYDKNKWKGKELVKFKDVRELDEQQEKVMAGYCNRDVYGTRELLNVMLPLIPDIELHVMDMTLRMAFDKRVQCEISILEDAIQEEHDKKKQYIATYTREALASNNKFANLLLSYGIEPPMKESPTTGKMTYAFSKKDKGFIDLQRDPIAAPICEARLSVKSTIAETRAQRFIDCMQTLNYLPVYLNYAGARATHRWSGGQKLNIQNMGRGSKLRQSIKAPDGYRYVVCDLSQIEVRVLAWLTGNQVVIEAFKNGVDPYIAFAADLFTVDINDVTKEQRQEAKAAVLSLGFQAGATSFRNVAETVYGVVLSEARAQEIVNIYRRVNYKVTHAWAEAQEILIGMANDPELNYEFDNGVKFLYQAVLKPNGVYLNFDNLHYHADRDDPSKNGMVYGEGRDRSYMYGGKLIQNLTQSIARDVIAWQMIEIKKQLNESPVCAVHDELWYIAKEDEADDLYKKIQQIMCTSPDWFDGVPLEAEGGVGVYYADAK